MKATIVINLDYESTTLKPEEVKLALEVAIDQALGSGDFTADWGVLSDSEVVVEIFK
jgi:methionine-rich copper-binding protein CopC